MLYIVTYVFKILRRKIDNAQILGQIGTCVPGGYVASRVGGFLTTVQLSVIIPKFRRDHEFNREIWLKLSCVWNPVLNTYYSKNNNCSTLVSCVGIVTVVCRAKKLSNSSNAERNEDEVIVVG